jgi:hypothetical protein
MTTLYQCATWPFTEKVRRAGADAQGRYAAVRDWLARVDALASIVIPNRLVQCSSHSTPISATPT